jgi:hypothetical protein
LLSISTTWADLFISALSSSLSRSLVPSSIQSCL